MRKGSSVDDSLAPDRLRSLQPEIVFLHSTTR